LDPEDPGRDDSKELVGDGVTVLSEMPGASSGKRVMLLFLFMLPDLDGDSDAGVPGRELGVEGHMGAAAPADGLRSA